MGCSNNREKSINLEEERIIGIAEDLLKFTSLDALLIDRTIHRYSISNRLTGSQFEAAHRDLNISFEDYNRERTPLGEFYNSFLNHDGLTYSTTKLCSLGLLLGKGSVKTKASILFQNYDLDLSKSIDQGEFKVLLEDLVDIALIRIPKLALRFAGEAETFLLKKYNRRIVSIKRIVTKFYIILIHPEKEKILSYQEFIDKFDSEDIQALVSSQRLREVATRHYNTVIAPSNLVKCYVLAEMSESKKLLDSTRGEEI